MSEGYDWPFRIHGDYIEWYNQHTHAWVVPVGCPDNVGYRMLTWKLSGGNRRFLRAHVVCWITHNGPIPDRYEIDHIDGDKANNTINNLRLVTHSENIGYARERLGNWSPFKLKPWQIDLILSISSGYNCPYLKHLASRWNVSKFYLGNLRSRAKKTNDPRYQGGL